MKEFRKEFAKKYLERTRKNLDSIEDDLAERIDGLVEILLKARDEGRTIYIMGNGGSASTASHFASDLSVGATVEGLPRFRAIALTDNIPNMLAWANDINYEEIFSEQLKNLMNPEDIVVGISGSGNSANVINAIEYANQNGGITIGLSGFDGGKLMKYCQESIHVPSFYMQRVEDFHLLVEHLLTSLIREEGMIKQNIGIKDFWHRKVIFLDRDGVINERPSRGEYVKNWEDFKFLPGAIESLKILAEEGYHIFLVSNQAGIGRGMMTEQDLSFVHQEFLEELKKQNVEIAGFYYCPHEMNENCDCRKPKPGLFLKAAKDYNINLRKAIFVGDEDRDKEAAKATGCKFIRVTPERNLLDIVKSL